MFSKKIQEAVNKQINFELSSAYQYLSMSAYFASQNLPGAAHWMRLQYQEEVAHGLRLFDYMNDRGAGVVLQAIDQPQGRFKSPLDVFEKVLAQEKAVTASIDTLYALAEKGGDYPTVVELQWFVKEQVEEEKNVQSILDQLRIIGEHGVSLLMLDRQLGARASG